jgi:hypothetical protein
MCSVRYGLTQARAASGTSSPRACKVVGRSCHATAAGAVFGHCKHISVQIHAYILRPKTPYQRQNKEISQSSGQNFGLRPNLSPFSSLQIASMYSGISLSLVAASNVLDAGGFAPQPGSSEHRASPRPHPRAIGKDTRLREMASIQLLLWEMDDI